MSERENTSESGHQNIVLSPEEKKVFAQLFQAADSEGIGVVTGELAVKFFEKSGLSPRILGEIWGIADTENRGLLTKVGFSVALRLIGQAQNGLHPRPELAQHPGPLPRFEGVNVVYPPPPPSASSPQQPAISSQPTGPVIRVPPLLPNDVEKFTALFEKSGAIDGLLQGVLAREIFQRSKLPNSALIQIWNLADRQHRGALGPAEFVVAMHLINSTKNGSLPQLPQVLPPQLFDAAANRQRRPPPPGRTVPPMPQIPKQFSGPQSHRAHSPLARQYTPPVPQPVGVQRDATGWAISAPDKQRFDQVFLTVAKANPDLITGEEAVPFFSNSKLPEETLAQIWDLADVNKAGQLTRDEFAIAMYLIVQQRNNPSAPLPDVLPLNLIPPSMRQQRPLTATAPQPQIQQPPGPFDPPPAPAPAPKSAADDLFGLDAFAPSTTQQPSVPAPSQAGPFDTNDVWGSSRDASPALSPAPTSPVPPAPSIFNRPAPAFVPQSSFGQSIMPASTGGSNASGLGVQQSKPDVEDLLGDADPEVSKKLTNETTELANLSNQIGSLTKQTQELKQKRASAEHDLNSLTAQKQHIEAQLGQLRSAYEKEVTQVRRVEEQLATSRADATKASQEYQKLEVEYNQLQYRKQEISSQLEADRRENENLKERMNLISVENRNLREELERLQSQARREKGLVAINKKQAAQVESERDKLKSNIEETRSSVTSPVPGSPTLSQSSTTNSRSTNPFSRGKSPPATENPFGQSSFAPPKSGSMDDVFGPAFNVSSVPFAPKAPTEISATGLFAPSASEGVAEHSTPPTSPPTSYHNSPQSSDAPPPPANPITSNFLPLQVGRADSTTSSVQVNPPVSVRGDSEFSRPDTPTNWMGSASGDVPARDVAKPDDVRRTSFSVKSDPGTDTSNKAPFPFEKRNEESRSPFAAALERNTTGTTSGGDENKPKLEKTDSHQDFSRGVPGSFPSLDSSLPIKPTATGESNMSNRSRTSNMSKSFDPFTINSKEGNSSKSDFDDAFKGFNPLGRVSENHTGGSGNISSSKFDKEFPPIREINDTDSDSEAGGFEDNFVSSSPAQKHAQLEPAQPANQGTAVPPDFPTTTSSPPPITAQQPPPSYPQAQATGSQEKSSFPTEFGSLLPSRSDPTRHDAPTPGGSTNAVAFPSTTSKPADAPKDEFDDEFGDLDDAKEADTQSTDNDFGASGFDDFNPVFDTAPSKTRAPPGTAISEDDFAKFSFNIDEPTPRAPSEPTAAQGVKPATAEEWDAIFADFPGPGPKSGEAKANGDSTGEKGVASSSRQSGTDPVEGGGVSLNPSSDLPSTSTATSSATPMGTATSVTEGGVKVASDDEKVSKLTTMGFDRERSLKALEKNGWNIDRAANSLIAES